MWTNLGYIHNNPIKAGYVIEPKDYLYSIALTYRDESKGLLKIELLPILSSVKWDML